MKNNTLVRIIIILVVYLAIKYFGGEVGRIVLKPINLFVTYLHEFGHAFGALITGGTVESLQVSADGSGVTTSRGGSRPIIIMGGYIGSAIFGNLLFLIGAKWPKVAQIAIFILASTMAISAIVWHNSLYTSTFLLIFAVALYFIASKTNLDRDMLMFLGLASIIYIIQDFNVGPGSDLKMYAEEMIFIPAFVWKYIWLAIVVILTFFNFRMIFKGLTFPKAQY
jgi:peptidase M50B-like protein